MWRSNSHSCFSVFLRIALLQESIIITHNTITTINKSNNDSRLLYLICCSKFPWAVNCSENYPQFGHLLLKRFASPVLGRKNLRNIGLKRRHIISLPGVTTYLGPVLLAPLQRKALEAFSDYDLPE